MSNLLDEFPEKALRVINSMSREDIINNFMVNLEIDRKNIEKDELTIFKILDKFSDKCIRCGNCCKTNFVQLSDEEELLYAKIKGDKFFDFLDEDHIFPHFKAPCGFLKNDNCCEINDIKPKVCKLYPFNFGLINSSLLQLVLCPFGKAISDEMYPLIKSEQKKDMKELGITEERMKELSKEIIGKTKLLTDRIISITGNDGKTSSVSQTLTFPRSGIDLLYKKLRSKK